MKTGNKVVESGGRPGVIGIRREDKNKWERRAPLAPRHVQTLVSQGFRVLVQPSNRRVFTDEEYKRAGGIIQEDLLECSTILGVKEVPPDLLLPGRNYCFFAHVIKAQPAGMPLLDTLLERCVRLLDYECITETGKRGDKRLVAFGSFAGNAGAIDFLRGMGERFLALGFSTPLLHVGSSFMYNSLKEACRAISIAGEGIMKNGLPSQLCPFTIVVTGTGNVAKGSLEILKLLPHEMVEPEQLRSLCESDDVNRHKVYISVAKAEHMVCRRDGSPFDKKDYYATPDKYVSRFQDDILPYSTCVVNSMYWDERFPKLFTRDDLREKVQRGQDKLLGVCDITCDADGSVPTKMFTSIEKPFFVYNALTDAVNESLDEPGVLFHAVDHLPSELPAEASEHFGECLINLLPPLANSLAPVHPNEDGGAASFPIPLKGAIVTSGGALTASFNYIDQLRAARAVEEGAPEDGDADAGDDIQVHAHGHGPPACATLEFTGHLFDTHLINRITDLVEAAHAKLHFLTIDVGAKSSDPTFASMMLMTHSEKRLQKLVDSVGKAADAANVAMRRVPSGTTLGIPKVSPQVQRLEAGKKILVLGSGFVVAPLLAYLLRRPENNIVLAGFDKEQIEDLASKHPAGRVRPEVLNVVATDESSVAKREELLKECDLVVSLVPAMLHVEVAKMAVELRKNMVTASYVSDQMQALHEKAQKNGVLILNEVGLDPGIDHLSAMQMIDTARANGSRIVSFKSLCGGLPSPEASASSPIQYKFSWSPKGVLVASQNSARYRQNGHIQEVPGEKLLGSYESLEIEDEGVKLELECLPNRDSTVFAKLYGLEDSDTFFRGTLRFAGFGEKMLYVAAAGLLQPGPLPDLVEAAKSGGRRRWLAKLVGAKGDSVEAIKAATSASFKKAGGKNDAVGWEFLEWLVLLDEGASFPEGCAIDQPVDVTSRLLMREENLYKPGETDMVVMFHELVVQLKNGQLERQTATMINFGEPHGDTFMAKSVGITPAICAQMILDAPKGTYGAGVQRPLTAQWYNPVLELLDAEGIRLNEKSEIIDSSTTQDVQQLQQPMTTAACAAISKL